MHVVLDTQNNLISKIRGTPPTPPHRIRDCRRLRPSPSHVLRETSKKPKDGLAHSARPRQNNLVLAFFFPTPLCSESSLFAFPPLLHFILKTESTQVAAKLPSKSPRYAPFHDMTKVAYVLRFRHVEFTTLQNSSFLIEKRAGCAAW